MNSISSTVHLCFGGFQLLSADVDSHEDATPPRPDVGSQLARFQVWAGNIGAHQTGESSLEYRLRDSSRLKNQVVKLLNELHKSLEEAHSILCGDQRQRENDDIFSGGDANSQTLDSDGLDSWSDGEITDAMELDEILAGIAECINCLFRLSVSIRNPAPHDRFRQLKQTDTSLFEQYDIPYVREKFPEATDEWITERLGKANSWRRQYFKYRKEHHERLSSGLEGETTDDGKTNTVASSLPLNLKERDSEGNELSQGAEDQDGLSESGHTETTYASRSATGEARMPPLPSLATTGPFECPFCYMIISAPTTHSWRKHVFGDLQPYICLLPNCPSQNETFPRRRQWINHVVKGHQQMWSCHFLGCNTSFSTIPELEDHLAQAHEMTGPQSLSPGPVDSSKTKPVLKFPTQCPLCQQSLGSIKEYQHHVGRHQKDLALFALPNIEEHDEEETETQDLEESVKGKSMRDGDYLDKEWPDDFQPNSDSGSESDDLTSQTKDMGITSSMAASTAAIQEQEHQTIESNQWTSPQEPLGSSMGPGWRETKRNGTPVLLQCPSLECDTTARNRRDLNRHLWAHHRELARDLNIKVETNACQNCGRVFNRRDNLVRHKKGGRCTGGRK